MPTSNLNLITGTGLSDVLVEKVIVSPRSRTELRVDLNPAAAAMARDALIKQASDELASGA